MPFTCGADSVNADEGSEEAERQILQRAADAETRQTASQQESVRSVLEMDCRHDEYAEG